MQNPAGSIKLSKEQLQALKSYIEQAIQTAEQYYTSEIEPKILEAYRRYKADPKYYEEKLGDLAKLSKIVSSDIADKIEWAMPSLMRIFFGNEDVISIKGRTPEDDKPAELMQQLVNWQLTRENDGFMVFYRWFKDALKYRLGIVKATWERLSDEEIQEVYVSPETYAFIKESGNSEPLFQELPEEVRQRLTEASKLEIVEAQYLEEQNLFRVKLKIHRTVKSAPKIENVLPFECIFIPDARKLHECSFVAHRKKVKADYLIRKQKDGVFANVEEAIRNEAGGAVNFSQLEQELYGSQKISKDSLLPNLKEITLYECYTKFDYDGDGLLEDVIVWYAGGQILRVDENPYGRPPFFALTPIIESESIMGRSFDDLIGQLQDLKTAILKLLMINATKVSNPRAFYDASVIPSDAIEQVKVSQYIPLNLAGKNIQQVIQFEPVQPIAQYAITILEYIETQIENRTGITRYNQGLDARSLNKTATGIQLIMSAANQRLELIARIFAETGVRDLFRFLVELNLRFLDQETIIRLTNEPLIVRPDDLKGRFDFNINARVSVGTKEMELQSAQMLLQIVAEATKAGLATPKELYNAYKQVITLLGYKNVDDFLKNPEEVLNAIQGANQGSGAMQGLPPELVQAIAGGAIPPMAGNQGNGTMDGNTPEAGNPERA